MIYSDCSLNLKYSINDFYDYRYFSIPAGFSRITKSSSGNLLSNAKMQRYSEDVLSCPVIVSRISEVMKYYSLDDLAAA